MAASTASRTKATLHSALLAAQKEMPDLQKNAINPHFKNTYITLDSLIEQVLPVLHKHGLLLIQAPDSTINGTPALRTILSHPATNDALDCSLMPLVLDRDNSQGHGSAITYARRYALMSILGLVADEDDDANEASKSTTKKSTTRTTTAAAPSGAL